MRSRLLYIPISAKGLSSTHRREEEWRRKKCEAPSGITSPEKIVSLSTDISQFATFQAFNTIRFQCKFSPGNAKKPTRATQHLTVSVCFIEKKEKLDLQPQVYIILFAAVDQQT